MTLATFPWSVAVPVATALGALIVGVYTARSARAANRETAQLTGWRSLAETHQAEIDRLREDREEDNARHKRERAEDQEALADLRRRVTSLTQRFEEAERGRRELLAWAREVVKRMREADFPYPPPPPGVADDGPH